MEVVPLPEYCVRHGLQIDTIAMPKVLPLLGSTRDRIEVHEYQQAHAYIAHLENARVFGNGFIVMDDALIAQGLTSGNYSGNLGAQLKPYIKEGGYAIPDGGELDGEYVLLWGNNFFGHWLFTYLMRLTLLWYRPEYKRFPILVPNTIPRRFLDWVRAMGFQHIVSAEDGVKLRKLIVPSVVTYKGGYDDQRPFLFPPAVEIMRHVLLKDLQLPRQPRERIYLSRAKDKYRNMVNEDALVKMLSAHNVKRVFMHELSLEAQLDLISRSDLIVVHIGSGSPITMFAPRDCVVIELTTEKFWGSFTNRAWAHILGQSFYRVVGEERDNRGEMKIDHDCEINVDEVEALIKGELEHGAHRRPTGQYQDYSRGRVSDSADY